MGRVVEMLFHIYIEKKLRQFLVTWRSYKIYSLLTTPLPDFSVVVKSRTSPLPSQNQLINATISDWSLADVQQWEHCVHVEDK